jgi:hypothetical protein
VDNRDPKYIRVEEEKEMEVIWQSGPGNCSVFISLLIFLVMNLK